MDVHKTPCQPTSRTEFKIAIISVLGPESAPILALLDGNWKDYNVELERAPGDSNLYTIGWLGNTNVIIAHIPNIGKKAAELVISNLHRGYPNIQYSILVGICGAVPIIDHQDVLIGDIIIGTSIVQYEFGRNYYNLMASEKIPVSHLEPLKSNVHVTLQKLQGKLELERLAKNTKLHFCDLAEKFGFEDLFQSNFNKRVLQDSNYQHRHRDPSICNSCTKTGSFACRTAISSFCSQIGCLDNTYISPFEPPPDLHASTKSSKQTGSPENIGPAIFFGPIASGDNSIRSALDRQKLSSQEDVIGFEMEGAGLWESTIIIKGVSDYADSHKNKLWQRYAAATASACTKALVAELAVMDDHTLEYPIETRFINHQRTMYEEDCLQLLDYQGMKMRLKPNILATTYDSCSWLRQDDTFLAWIRQTGGLLWITGNSGAGKSTLLNYAFDNIKDIISSPVILGKFTFHSQISGTKKTTEYLLRSLIQQITDKIPSLLTELNIIYRQKRYKNQGDFPPEWSWNEPELEEFFKNRILPISRKHPIKLFIDAIDELEENNMIKLLNFFQILTRETSNRSHLSICFASRYSPLLAHYECPSIRLEERNKKGIENQVLTRLAEVSFNDSQRLLHEVIYKSSGNFQWANLAISKITSAKNDGKSCENILQYLENLPNDLYGFYQRILSDIKPSELKEAFYLLQWVCLSQRPLYLSELPWAMVLVLEDKKCFMSLNEYQRLHGFWKDEGQIRGNIMNLSKGLLSIVESEKEPQVGFIHESVYHYMMEHGLQELSGRSNDLSEMPHVGLAKACLRYLVAPEVLSLSSRRTKDNFDMDNLDMDLMFKFLRYTLNAWIWHAQEAEKQKADLSDLIDIFNWPSNEGVIALCQIEDLEIPYAGRYGLLSGRFIHIAARNGLYSVVARCISLECTRSIHKSDQGHEIHPFATANCGATEKGFDIDSKDQFDNSPLVDAAKNRHRAIVELLLQNGADIENSDGDGRTAIIWASINGDEELVDILVKNGGNMEANAYGTPLLWGAKKGHRAVVELLLNHKANKETTDSINNWTPLLWAAANGHRGTTEILLNFGAQFERIGRGERSALRLASIGGHRGVVELLIHNGADIEATGYDHCTPLLLASKNGYTNIVKLLLENGANVEAKDGASQTSLIRASLNGHGEIVELLIKNGAKLSANELCNLRPIVYFVINEDIKRGY